MPFSLTTSLLIAVFTLALFLSVLDFFIWRMQRDDQTPFWLAAWLAASAVFALCRLLQYSALDETAYRVIPRVLLTASYTLAYLGYELANAFIAYRPSRRERFLFIISAAVPMIVLWVSNLILTDQIIIRTTFLGGTFHGVNVGSLYLPANFWILLIGIVPPIRLLHASRSKGLENTLMAIGFFMIILFSLNDFIATSLNSNWIRLSDFNYLPVALFFSYIQIQRIGRLFRNLDVMVHERTVELQRNAAEMAALYETTHDLAIENSRLFQSEQRQNQETAAIAEVSRDISASLQLAVVLEKIAKHARDLLHAETSAVYLAEPANRILHPIAAIGPDADEIKQSNLVYGEGILGYIALQKNGEIVNETASDPRAIIIEGTERVLFEHLLGVPVLSKERLTGLIAIWRIGEGLGFKPNDLDFMSNLAGQVAVAIENARLFEETQKRLREMEGIAQVSAAISRTLELEPLLENILQSAIHAIPAGQRGSILLADEEKNLKIRAVWGYFDVRVHMHVFPLGSGYSSIAFCQRQAIVIPDVQAETNYRYAGDIPEMLAGGSAIAAPLIVKDRAIGVIALDTPIYKDAFSESDVKLLEAIAASAALAIENARLFEYTQHRLAELEILQTIASALRLAQTLDEALPIIFDQLVKLLKVESASLEMLDLLNREIVTELACGQWASVTGLRTPMDVGVSARVINTGQPYVTTNAIADGYLVRPDLVGKLSVVACVPVVAHRQPIGALWVGRLDMVPFTHEEVSLLTALGEMVGNTIQRMKLHEQTERQAEEIISAYDLTLEGWAKALELRDKETEGHSRRVTDLTIQLAQEFGFSESEMIHIRRGVLLHDIGKMGVADQVLRKAGPLNPEEWKEMKKHPEYAFDLIYPITFLRPSLDIPYSHHEHWDGSGYPRGLCEKQIPLAARIFSIVDVFDALTSDRPYRRAWPRQAVIDYLCEQSGIQFDPEVVATFLQLIHKKGLD